MAVDSVRHGLLCNNSGLSILLHSVISLPDATSYDKASYCMVLRLIKAHRLSSPRSDAQTLP